MLKSEEGLGGWEDHDPSICEGLHVWGTYLGMFQYS